MSSGTELATDKPRELRHQLQDAGIQKQLANALPTHCKPERFTRICCTALLRDPKLAECTPQSFFNCVFALAQWGLEPDGRNAHLIPRWNGKLRALQATYVIDYKGYVELAMRSGLIATIHADIVYDRDEYEWDMGQVMRHKIDLRTDRGERYAAYALVQFKDGARKCEQMTIAEALAIRDKSDGWKAHLDKGYQSPWADHENEMIKKTAFRRLSKWISISSEFREAVEYDEQTPIFATSIEAHEPSKPRALTVSLDDEPAEVERSDLPLAGNGVFQSLQRRIEMCGNKADAARIALDIGSAIGPELTQEEADELVAQLGNWD